MRWLPKIRPRELTLKKKLFGYMLLLAVLLVLVLLGGLFLFGRFDSTDKDTYESLNIQMDVFERDVFRHFDGLAAAGIRLSEDTSEFLDEYLDDSGIAFAQITDSEELIYDIQSQLIKPLRETLLQEACSGVFVMLDTTVNSKLEGAELSRAGIYLQVNGYESSDRSVLLYRGQAQVGKENSAMPHRKWRQEFRTDLFPDYDRIMSEAALPLEKTYRFTDLVTLPGTSEKVILVVVPVMGNDGTVYGLCGYEVSNSYFMAHHAQMTRIRHLTGLVTFGSGDALDTSEGLSCGVVEGYYRHPQGMLEVSAMPGGMLRFEGDVVPYVGLQRTVTLSPNNEDFVLSVMMLGSDYDNAVRRSKLQNVLLFALVLFFCLQCCRFFSKRFLNPILQGIEQIKAEDRADAQFDVVEINDLFDYLAEKDRAHEETLRLLDEERKRVEEEKLRIQNEYNETQSKYETVYAKIKRMEKTIGPEIDPDDYQTFERGIQTLTPTERRVFDCYLEGKNVAEIIEIFAIKESTLRFHNKNIYSKLGVSSLKQLLHYAMLMKKKEE